MTAKAKLPERITITMSLFPRWLWDARDADTGIVVKRFRTTQEMVAWELKHYAVMHVPACARCGGAGIDPGVPGDCPRCDGEGCA